MYGFFDFVFTLGAQAGTCEGCAGSALHPIAAALGTLGYYAQAGWLEQILYFGFGNWAILAYVLAGVGLLISVAMGQPPKMYLWFVIGPPLFYWLVENRTPSTGVEWRVGKQHRDMSEVWKLSEVGLYNTPYIIRHGFEVYSDAPPDGSDSSGPDGEFSDCYDYACVSDFFAWFDQLISDTVHELIGIIGLNIVKERVAPDDETNISSGGDLEADFDSQFQDITSQYRWQFFASIADARLSNTDFRQLFSTFMANECGDALLNSIDKRIFSAMKNKQPDDNDLFEYVIKMNSSGKLKLWENLRNAGAVPMPRSLEKILDAHASDAESFAVQSNIKAIVDATNKKNKITCRTLMQVIIHGFRWEAANISYQLINSGPSGVDPTQFVAHMVYGWAVKEYEVDLGFQGDQLTNEQILKFLESYILVHLFKNELRIAPQNPAEKPVLASERMVQSTEDFQAVNGQKSKFGELHVWSRMVPYFQGQLLYFLALAYPFACMLIVVPGMHTMFFQWMQFWIWVKLWDLGFALAMMIERTIWAMTVNKFANQEANNTLQWLFANPSEFPGVQSVIEPWHGSWTGATLPTKIDIPLLNDLSDPYGEMVDILLGASQLIDLNLSTSDYIYIMSALYFAVPVVTGSLVLGAKSGISSMVGSTMGQISQPAGSAAGQAASADVGANMKMNQAIGRQNAFAKSLRASGLAGKAIGAANRSTLGQIMGSAAQTDSQLTGIVSQKAGLESQGKQSQATTHAYGISGLQQAGNYFSREGGGFIDRGHDGEISVSNRESSSQRQNEGEGSEVSGALKLARKVVGGISNYAMPLASYAVQADRHQYGNERLATQGASANEQAGYASAGFSSTSEGQLSGLSASRMEAQASFEAEQAAWESANDYAMQNADYASSIGLGAGYLDAGQAPTNLQGMARSGMLGEKTARASRSPDQGGRLWRKVQGKKGAIEGRARSIASKPIELHDVGTGSALVSVGRGLTTLGVDTTNVGD